MSALTDATPASPPEPLSVARRVLRNSLAVTSADWMIKATNLAFTVYVVRGLGEVGYGKYSSAVAFVGLFGVWFELGLAESAQRAIARDRGRLNELFWNVVALRLLLAVPGLLVLPLLAWLVGHEPDVVIAVTLHTGTFLIASVLIPLLIVLTSHERHDVAARLAVVMNLVYIAIAVALLTRVPGYLTLLSVAYLTMPLQVCFTVLAIRRLGIRLPPFSIAPSRWTGLMRGGLPFGISSLALTFNHHADTVMLSVLGTAAVVGWYSAAYRLIFSLSSAVAGFTRSITPTLSRLHVHDTDAALRWVRGGLLGLAFVTLPAAVGLSLLAGPVIGLLYGESFGPSGLALAVLAWDFPLLAIAAFGGNVMTAMDRERSAARVYIGAAIFNAVMNALFIPRYGLLAAAVVTVATDALVLLALYGPVWSKIAQGGTQRQLQSIAVASTVMGIIVWFVRDRSLLVSIPVGVVTYAVVCTLVGLPRLVLQQWGVPREA